MHVQSNVNPNFKSVWLSDKPYNVLKGGRNSFKSSVIVLRLVKSMLMSIKDNQSVNVVVIRKVANTIRDSVYNKIQWALKQYDVLDDFSCTVSPFRITHKATKSSFYFYGQDDFAKLKSNDINNIIAVWYEEAAEFGSQEEFDQTNITFMRQKHESIPFVKFYWSYNPPRNPYHWINEWSEQQKSNSSYLVHSSSYLDDELGFVTEQMLKDIERIKDNDYDYYRYIYLGEPVGLGTNVYNIDLFKATDKIPRNERVVAQYFAVDSGHQQSATTCLHLVMTTVKRVYLIDTYYYSPAGKVNKKAPSTLSRELYEFITKQSKLFNAQVRQLTIDSAEGALRNQFYQDYGQRFNPVAKKKKITMTEYVQSLLAQGRFYYLRTENNEKYFISEHKRYIWDERTIMNDNPAVVKDDDHTCDAFQYFVVDNLDDLELR